MKILECEFRQAFVTAFAREQGRVRKRRKIELPAKIVFLVGEALIIVMSCKLHGGRMRGKSLDDYFTLHFSPPGTASYLSKQLECSFSSPEVGCMEREVSIQDACEGDIRKIQALCDHLRA